MIEARALEGLVREAVIGIGPRGPERPEVASARRRIRSEVDALLAAVADTRTVKLTVRRSGVITRVAGSFVVDGFTPGNVIRGSKFRASANNVRMLIKTVTDRRLTVQVADRLVGESGMGRLKAIGAIIDVPAEIPGEGA